MFSSCIFERTRFGFRPAVTGPNGSNLDELGRRREGLIGEAERDDGIAGRNVSTVTTSLKWKDAVRVTGG